MAHMSENNERLSLQTIKVSSLRQIASVPSRTPKVFLFLLPYGRSRYDASLTKSNLKALGELAGRMHGDSTICILTTPPDAAGLIASLSDTLNFRHWIVVKTVANSYEPTQGRLPNRHAALLVFTKYSSGLKHTKTRIKYGYCPACGKTTKDYGGKKHLYHEYGTAISDVWRDIEWSPREYPDLIIDRLRDFFGIRPYRVLKIFDLRKSQSLLPRNHAREGQPPNVPESRLSVEEHKLTTGLIHGDCIEVLRSIPDNSVDFAFADLPYNLGKKYYRCKDDVEITKYFDWCHNWLTELYRVLKPGHTLAVLNIPVWAARHLTYLSTLMEFQNWIAWDALSFPVRKIMPAHYGIVCFSKGSPRVLPSNNEDNAELPYLKAKKEDFCNRRTCISNRSKATVEDREILHDLWHDVYRLMHNSQRVSHPCQLPPLLMRRLFALFTRPNELVLDCFNGAGTSTLVANQMDRQFIGIEISKRFHNLATQRHEMLENGEDPFRKHSTVPKVKNSMVQRMPKQRYRVSKKMLQLEVKRIANKVGHLPTYEEVNEHSQHPVRYFKKYFASWGEVCAAARSTGMAETPSI
jgi:DNA modification methylase